MTEQSTRISTLVDYVNNHGTSIRPNVMVESDLVTGRPFPARFARVLVATQQLFNNIDVKMLQEQIFRLNGEQRDAGKPMLDGSHITLSEALANAAAVIKYRDAIDPLLINRDARLTGFQVSELSLDPTELEKHLAAGAGTIDMTRVAAWSKKQSLYEAALAARAAIFDDLRSRDVTPEEPNGWSLAQCQTSDFWAAYEEAIKAFAVEVGFEWDGTPTTPTPPVYPVTVVRVFHRDDMSTGFRYIPMVADGRHKAAVQILWEQHVEWSQERQKPPTFYRRFVSEVCVPLNLLQDMLRSEGVKDDRPTVEAKVSSLAASLSAIRDNRNAEYEGGRRNRDEDNDRRGSRGKRGNTRQNHPYSRG